MYKNKEENTRSEKFRRNNLLESFLSEINNDLWNTEKKLFDKKEPDYPLIFIIGSHRSGSTLMTQWLSSLGSISYPTNFMSRFYKTPIIASKMQLLLTDERYNYRDELRDFNSSINFNSENGKTKGALSPNEFWYFWRRFLPFNELELAGITNVFQKPFALKGMILNYNIDFLDKLFEKAIFIYTKRDPLSNIESALKAREKQFGDLDKWYSFKIPEYKELKKLTPYEQVAGQVYYINKAIVNGLENILDHKKIIVKYEDFCKNPEFVYDELVAKLKLQDCELKLKYIGEEKFDVKRKIVKDSNILNAYRRFYI